MRDITGVMMTLWQTDEQKAHVRRVADHFERLNDMTVKIFDENSLGDRPVVSPCFARYYLWDILPDEVERVIYMDSDIIPLKPLPNAPTADFAAAPDQEQLFKKFADRCPAIKRAGLYFNAGLFVANRKTERLFRHMTDIQSHMLERSWPWFYDQTQLNIEVRAAVERGEITFNPLTKRWNNITMVDEEYVADPYMVHFAGTLDGKLRVSRAVIDTFDWIETLVRGQSALRAKDGETTDR